MVTVLPYTIAVDDLVTQKAQTSDTKAGKIVVDNNSSHHSYMVVVAEKWCNIMEEYMSTAWLNRFAWIAKCKLKILDNWMTNYSVHV